MQCNTNYTADETNFNYLNLRVINEYKKEFPNILYGLSDHTLGSVSLVAVGMGIHAVENILLMTMIGLVQIILFQ